MFPLRRLALLLPLAACPVLLTAAETPKKKAAPARKAAPTSALPAADWVEPDFPFFSSVLDARKVGAALAPDNLTPRGIVLNLGHNLWACFDTDLLRLAAVWQGAGVKPTALAPGSYHDVSRKTVGGQSQLALPEGELWSANGIYPGWQAGAELRLQDPREPAPSREEIGRGPIPENLGRFEAVRLTGNTVVLEYTVAGTRIREHFAGAIRDGTATITRSFEVAAGPALVLAVGALPAGAAPLPAADAAANPRLTLTGGRIATAHLAARKAPATFAIEHHARGIALRNSATLPPATPPPARWPQEVPTAVKFSTAPDAYVVDHIRLPFDNPWRRVLRPGDIQFLPDGTGVMITLDGDVWLARGLDAAKDRDTPVRWRRFTSGLHEPLTIAIRDGQIYAFDKNGIWRLRDTDGNGEADVHELFSNAFAQTADNREFAAQIRLAPRGEFVIAKGGQQDSSIGKHNGSVLRISADGKRSTVLGYGFRQPNIGVNVRTGLVTSSDQQGQYIPSTPLHIVRDRQFYGFLGSTHPREQYPSPPAEPLTWIPHAVDSSALSQVWLFNAKMGPLNDQLVHIGFNRPEVFRVILNERASRPQASVVSITQAFEFPPLNGSVSPVDGLLYIAGFQVLGWGNILDVTAGFGRVRYTGAPVTLPREVVPMDKGVLLRFETELDAKQAANPASYSLQTWSYKRTYKYGSPQYKEDGTPGQDALVASAAYLAPDGRSVFVAVPGMKPVMQLRIGWSLATRGGLKFEQNAYTTPYELVRFDPKAEGFGNLEVDLTPRAATVAETDVPVTIEEGQRLAQLFACIACHDTATEGLVKAGPTWKGLYGSKRTVSVAGKPQQVEVNDAYLRESILDPTAKVAAGFEKGEYAMPSFAGVLNAAQIDSLVLYIKTLK